MTQHFVQPGFSRSCTPKFIAMSVCQSVCVSVLVCPSRLELIRRSKGSGSVPPKVKLKKELADSHTGEHKESAAVSRWFHG